MCIRDSIHPGPDSTDELIDSLAEAEHNQIIGADSRKMLEGVIRMADMTAGAVSYTHLDVYKRQTSSTVFFGAAGPQTRHLQIKLFCQAMQSRK